MKMLLVAALLAASPVALNAQATQPEVTLGPNSALLSLTSEGLSRRVPDIAMFSAGVVTQAQTAGKAIRENSGRMDRVIAALKRAGIAERDIQTSAINLSPVYSDPERDAQIRARQTGQPYIPPRPEEQVRRTVAGTADPETTVRELVALANGSGGPDNVSCVVADVVEGER